MTTPFTAGQKVRASRLNEYLAPGAWVNVSGALRANLATDWQPLRYRKLAMSNSVEIIGMVVSGAAGILFTLPSGYRPAKHSLIVGLNSDGTSNVIQILYTTGQVDITASGGAWTYIHDTFPLD